MGLRPTHMDETHPRCRPRESGDPRPLDSRSPAFAEDKFRGNDVTFDGVIMGLWPTRVNESRSATLGDESLS
jgi:hypothetical protein